MRKVKRTIFHMFIHSFLAFKMFCRLGMGCIVSNIKTLNAKVSNIKLNAFSIRLQKQHTPGSSSTREKNNQWGITRIWVCIFLHLFTFKKVSFDALNFALHIFHRHTE